jgi:hypothetical protein
MRSRGFESKALLKFQDGAPPCAPESGERNWEGLIGGATCWSYSRNGLTRRVALRMRRIGKCESHGQDVDKSIRQESG